ncbi:IS1380 family transposase [Persicobacter psychrovividus]|uniref:IS1380 family transposase n=1 Tax=Persicobacter psychrovividus TaxID=387638 RepID=A0ABN6LKH4_9BACT|nr:IS1380 family transposase [Persicobacter psychrovividus]
MKVRKRSFRINSKAVKHSFSSKDLTSFGGLSMLSDFWSKHNIFDLFKNNFGQRNSNAQKFSLAQILMLLSSSAFCGMNRLEKISRFSADPLVRYLFSLKEKISRQTITNQLKNMHEEGTRNLEALLLKQNAKWLLKTKLGHIVFDADSTVKTVYGNQEGAEKGYNEYKRGAKSYHPLVMFVHEIKLLYHTKFRPGDSHTANGIKELIAEAKGSLPKSVKNVTFRADYGFFSKSLIDYLEEIGWSYLIKVKLRGLDKLLRLQKYEITDEGIEVARFEHQGVKWDSPLQFHAVRWVDGYEIYEPTGDLIPVYKYSCYATNMAFNPENSHDFYKRRSISETWIEQVKSHVKAGSTLTNSFWANDVLWQLACFAYNSSICMRINHLVHHEEHQTFVDWMVRIPAKLIRTARQLRLSFSEKYLYRRKWEEFYFFLNYN